MQVQRGRAPEGSTLHVTGRIADAVFLGGHVDYRIAVGGQTIAVEISGAAARHNLAIGTEVTVAWSPCAQTVLADE